MRRKAHTAFGCTGARFFFVTSPCFINVLCRGHLLSSRNAAGVPQLTLQRGGHVTIRPADVVGPPRLTPQGWWVEDRERRLGLRW